MNMRTIFYLTDASKEDKIAYYQLMEDNWEKERKKTHTQIAVKAFILMILRHDNYIILIKNIFII